MVLKSVSKRSCRSPDGRDNREGCSCVAGRVEGKEGRRDAVDLQAEAFVQLALGAVPGRSTQVLEDCAQSKLVSGLGGAFFGPPYGSLSWRALIEVKIGKPPSS